MSTLSRLGLGAALLASLAVPAQAQVAVGAKAGLNVTNFSGDDANNSESRLGFVGGLTGRFAVTPMVSVQAEALYAQKGDTFDAVVLDGARDYQIDTRIDYLEIPVSVRVGVPLSELLDAGVYLGGYAGIPLTSKVSLDGDAPNDVIDDVANVDIDAATDYGVLLGVDVGSGPFYLDARYSLGLADVTDNDPVFGSGLDRKNSAVSLTFGYRFGGGARRY